MGSFTDENIAKVTAWILGQNINYPILIDVDRKASEAFHIEGIPQSFISNREGKLVASPSTCEPGTSSSRCSPSPASNKH